MSAAAYVWAVGMAEWTYFGLANNHAYPFPSLADVGFVGYSVPAAVALFSFKRPGGTTRVGLLRSVLDAAVIAPLLPYAENPRPDRKAFALALDLLPYAPILVAVVMVAAPHVHELSSFLLVVGRTTIVLILVRQVLIIIENITLTSGLEQGVAARTAELEGLGAIVNSSANAIMGTTPEGLIPSWNPGAEKQPPWPAGSPSRRCSLLRRRSWRKRPCSARFPSTTFPSCWPSPVEAPRHWTATGSPCCTASARRMAWACCPPRRRRSGRTFPRGLRRCMKP